MGAAETGVGWKSDHKTTDHKSRHEARGTRQ
jgi:hypothetical protein